MDVEIHYHSKRNVQYVYSFNYGWRLLTEVANNTNINICVNTFEHFKYFDKYFIITVPKESITYYFIIIKHYEKKSVPNIFLILDK